MGGDWTLELHSGLVATAALSFDGYQGLLADDNNDTRATATVATLGVLTAGRIESTTDIDYFAFNVAAPGLLSLEFARLADSYWYARSFTISIEDAAGLKLAVFQDAQAVQSFTVAATQSGVYYAKIVGMPFWTYEIGAYDADGDPRGRKHRRLRVRVQRFARDGRRAGDGQRGDRTDRVLPGCRLFCDFDCFLRVPEPRIRKVAICRRWLLFRCLGKGRRNACPVLFGRLEFADLRLRRRAGGNLLCARRRFLMVQPGLRRQALHLTARHTAAASPVDESGPNDSQAMAQPVPLGGLISGQLETNQDLDHYAFSAVSSGVLTVRLNRSLEYSSSDRTRLSVLDANGTVLGTMTDQQDPRLLSVGLAQAGTYTLRVDNEADIPFLVEKQNDKYTVATAFAVGRGRRIRVRAERQPRWRRHAGPGQRRCSASCRRTWTRTTYAVSAASAGTLQLNFVAPWVPPSGCTG